MEQPITYHAISNNLKNELVFGFSGLAVIDLTPGFGELCASSVVNHRGYVGICQTDAQRDYVTAHVTKAVFEAMQNPESKMYCPEYADSHKIGKRTATPASAAAGANAAPPASVVPKQAAAKAAEQAPAAGGTQLSHALQQMLKAAKEHTPKEQTATKKEPTGA